MRYEFRLFVLPPVASGYWVYIGGREGWGATRPGLIGALQAAGKHMEKVIAYERGGRRGEPPTWTSRERDLPDLEPRWSGLIIADTSEERTEWVVEALDESAWRVADYDLRVLLDALAARIEKRPAVSKPVQGGSTGASAAAPLAINRPVPVETTTTPPAERNPGRDGGDFSHFTRTMIGRLEREIGMHEEALASKRGELRALRGALATYERANGFHKPNSSQIKPNSSQIAQPELAKRRVWEALTRPMPAGEIATQTGLSSHTVQSTLRRNADTFVQCGLTEHKIGRAAILWARIGDGQVGSPETDDQPMEGATT